MPYKLLFACTLFLSITACANPTVVPPVTVDDTHKTCPELRQDKAETVLRRLEAQEQKGFHASDVLIAPAVVSSSRIDKAIDAANARIEKLDYLLDAKGCYKEGYQLPPGDAFVPPR